MNTLAQQAQAQLILQTQVYAADIEDCYRDGYVAGHNGLDDCTNPYHHQSLENEYWLNGWWDGIYQKAPVFTVNIPAQPRASALPKWIKQKSLWQWTVGVVAVAGVTALLVNELAA